MNASKNLQAFCQFQIFTEVLENSWYLKNSQGSNDCRQGAASTSTLTTFESVNSEGPFATVTSKYHQTSPEFKAADFHGRFWDAMPQLAWPYIVKM